MSSPMSAYYVKAVPRSPCFSLNIFQRTPMDIFRSNLISFSLRLHTNSNHPSHSSIGLGSTTLGLHEPLLHRLPINHIPNGIHIIRTNISIIDVIGMLPNINAEKRNESGGGLKRILVGTGGDFDASCKTKNQEATTTTDERLRRRTCQKMLPDDKEPTNDQTPLPSTHSPVPA